MSLAPAAWRVAQSHPLAPAASRVDVILSTCPTASDVAAIERDFMFTFDSDPGPIICTPGGTEAGARLAVINAFRCMRALTFSPPIPIIGTNVYDWLRSKGIRGIHFFDGEGASTSGGVDRMLRLRRQVLDGKARVWADGSSGRALGIEGLIGLVVHEAGHRDPDGKGHDCDARGRRWIPDPSCGVTKSCPANESSTPGWYVDNETGQRLFEVRADGLLYRPDGSRAPGFTVDDGLASNDSSLGYGGAWAAQYQFLMACASHPALTERERAYAGYAAGWLVKDGRLSCGIRSSTVSVPAPPDTRPTIKRAPPWVPQARLQSARVNVGAFVDQRIVDWFNEWKPLSHWTQTATARSLPPHLRWQTDAGVATVGALAHKWTAADYRALAKAAAEIGTKPAYLLLVLYSESRLNPRAAFPGNHAVGLNQITPIAAKALGMTEAERLAILDMSVQQQLPIVVRSFKSFGVKSFDSPQALYQHNAAPATSKKGSRDDVVVYPAGSAGYKGNAGLDYDKDGVLTVGDLRMHLEGLAKHDDFKRALADMVAATGESGDLGAGLGARLPPNAFEWLVAAGAVGSVYYLASTRWPWLAFW